MISALYEVFVVILSGALYIESEHISVHFPSTDIYSHLLYKQALFLSTINPCKNKKHCVIQM